MREHRYFVYILSSKPHGTLYVGVTNDLIRRVSEHRDGLVPGFTKKHHIHQLVWFDEYGDVNEAIAQEKRLKRWRRDWKRSLIERTNPGWLDLYPAISEGGPVSAALRQVEVVP